MRCGEARCRTCRLRFRRVHSRRSARPCISHARQRLTIVPARTRRRIRHVVTLRNDPSIKRHRFADSPNRAGHASPSSLGAMFRYRPRLIAAWPSDWSFPLIARRRSWGSVAPFAGLLPHTGGGSFLIGPGPPACSSKRRAPIDFRRVDSPLHRRRSMRAEIFAANHVRLDWLLGFTPVCGPHPKAPGRPVAINELRPSSLRDRSCLGLHLSQACGHTACIRTGSTPYESSGRDGVFTVLSAPSFRSWAYIRVFAATFFEVATTRTSLQRLSA